MRKVIKMNELTEQMEQDQTDIIDQTKDINSLANQIKKLRALENEMQGD